MVASGRQVHLGSPGFSVRDDRLICGIAEWFESLRPSRDRFAKDAKLNRCWWRINSFHNHVGRTADVHELKEIAAQIARYVTKDVDAALKTFGGPERESIRILRV